MHVVVCSPGRREKKSRHKKRDTPRKSSYHVSDNATNPTNMRRLTIKRSKQPRHHKQNPVRTLTSCTICSWVQEVIQKRDRRRKNTHTINNYILQHSASTQEVLKKRDSRRKNTHTIKNYIQRSGLITQEALKTADARGVKTKTQHTIKSDLHYDTALSAIIAGRHTVNLGVVRAAVEEDARSQGSTVVHLVIGDHYIVASFRSDDACTTKKKNDNQKNRPVYTTLLHLFEA